MTKRYIDNPFTKNLVIKTKSKQVTVNALGAGDNVLINQVTGEISGTHVVTHKRVDGEEFVKLFSKNIALTFGLTSAGIKSLNVVIWTIQETAINSDVIILDRYALEQFINSNSLVLSIATFKRGISDLERVKIIAKTMRKSNYFINPNFVFNGNRIAFSTTIERK